MFSNPHILAVLELFTSKFLFSLNVIGQARLTNRETTKSCNLSSLGGGTLTRLFSEGKELHEKDKGQISALHGKFFL